VQARVGNSHDTSVWVYGAEGKVGGLGFPIFNLTTFITEHTFSYHEEEHAVHMPTAFLIAIIHAAARTQTMQ
jgi:hypothetical protein